MEPVKFPTGRKGAMLALKDQLPTLIIADPPISRTPRHMYKRAEVIRIAVNTNCVQVLLSSVGVRQKTRS